MKKKITVMVEEGLLKRVDELAVKERRSRNNLIVQVLASVVRRDEEAAAEGFSLVAGLVP